MGQYLDYFQLQLSKWLNAALAGGVHLIRIHWHSMH